MNISDYNLTEQIKMIMAVENVSISELARRMNTTRQNLGQRLKRGTFSPEELQEIAKSLGYKLEYNFTKINK